MSEEAPPIVEIQPEGEIPPEPPAPLTAEQIAAELEATRSALKKANREAADRRKKLDAYELAETARAQSELSETERLKAELAQARTEATQAQERARTTTLRSAVQLAAQTLGFLNPADALALADLSAVTVDDEGQAAGVDDALKALARTRPYLLKPASQGIGTPARPVPGSKSPRTEPAPSAPLFRF